MHREIKDHLNEIKTEHNKLLKIVQDNCNTPFFKEISEKMDDVHIDVRNTFSEYLWKCIHPISYKTVSKESSNSMSHRGMPAVGKWFGNIRRSNITYYNKDVWESLTQEHIDLIPSNKKRKIVQDFYDFKNNTHRPDIVRYPLCNQFGHLHKLIMFQTANYEYYATLKEEYPIKFNEIELSVHLQPYKIYFTIVGNGSGKGEHKESYSINKKSNVNGVGITNSVSSTALRTLEIKNVSNENENRIYLDSPNMFLTDEIKSAMLSLVSKGKEIQENWVKLKTKYAYLLLQKGNI